MMVLYTEDQLEAAYNSYRLHQLGQGVGFMQLEDFRILFEDLMQIIYEE